MWKVIDPRDGGIERALKLVSLTETGPAGFARAVREARILASAQHPALVTCHSFFEEPREGVVGLLMDLVAGRSLADAIENRSLDRGQTLAVLAQVTEALAYVHAENLVHRDLKPANIMLTDAFRESATRTGAVKLVDFGIAAEAGNATQLTRPGSVIGTLPYLAPELVDPASWGRSDGPSRDIFALGVLACQLLTARHPTGLGFDAAMIDFARAYKAAEAGRIPWPPQDLEGSWGVAIAACLALRPDERPANGSAVLEVLRTGAPSARASRPVKSRLTSLHDAPRSEAPTEMRSTPVSVRTEPMPSSLPAAVRTIEQAPLRVAPVKAPAPPSRKLWAALLLLVGAIVGAAIFALLPDRSAEIPSIPLPAAAPPTPMPTDPAAQMPVTITPCRRTGIHFDPSDTRFGCPVCLNEPGALPPSQTWQMRFHGVTPAVPLSFDPTRKICAQVTGAPPVCMPFTSLPGAPGGPHRLPITTADINGDRIYFSIRGVAGIEAKGYAHRKAGTSAFLETALCAGFVLYLDDPAVTLTVFLDDR